VRRIVISLEENKAIVRRYFEEAVNGKNWDLVDELLAPDFNGFQETPGNKVSRDDVKQMLADIRNTSPDQVQIVDDLIAEGDKVVARWHIQGSLTGEYMGVQGQGQKFNISGMEIFRFKDGKIVEHWFSADVYGMMQQVGAIPTPPQSTG
jgi:steroid delta-isomerase-like uncharacterized protein